MGIYRPLAVCVVAVFFLATAALAESTNRFEGFQEHGPDQLLLLRPQEMYLPTASSTCNLLDTQVERLPEPAIDSCQSLVPSGRR
jgi:hypothetical protein